MPHPYQGRTRLLILQSTPFCNIDCSYCYLPNRTDKSRMPFEIVEAAVRLVFLENLPAPDFTIVWHSGEPLVLPPAWYRRAIAVAQKSAPSDYSKIPHAIQTNALLINDDWCDLFLEQGIRLGVSIDGPARIHDERRKTRAGAGTHSRAMKGIELLKRRGVPFHIICVVGKPSLEAADEIMEFLAQNDLRNIGFNIEEIEGVNRSSTLLQNSVADEYFRFFSRVLELAQGYSPPLIIREQQELLANLAHPAFGRLSRNSQNEPFGFLTVSAQGDVFTFSPELAGQSDDRYPDYSIGKLPHDNFQTMINGEKFLRILNEINLGIESCRQKCRYFDLCLGGAPANKMAETGFFSVDETRYCKHNHQAVADAVLQNLEAQLL